MFDEPIRVMFIYWGRRGLTQFAMEAMSAALKNNRLSPTISVSRQNESFTRFQSFGSHVFPVDTFSRSPGAVTQAWQVPAIRKRFFKRLQRDRTQVVIELMPRRLTDGERSGDRLFLHLQVLSSVFLLMCPALGGVLRGWLGGGIGLIVGWMVRTWMRRSMGLRGANPNDGFFIRMRERANGARRGVLDAVIENVRHRQFNREQCIAITRAWDETGQRLARITSQEEKRALINALDAKVKRISYGQYD